MEEFTHELTPGNTKAAMKAVGAASSDLWKVAPDQLRTLDGFNARIKNDAYAARVRWIADSIKANGFYPDKPLTGFVALEDGEEVIYVTGGHRRHEGVLLHALWGHDQMSYRERDIKHEAPGGRYWVLDTGKAYAVMVVGVTHSTSESAYERTPDGLGIAVTRCNYLAAKRVDTHL